MNERAGEYAGLDRYEARKRIVAKMDELGLLVKIEGHVPQRRTLLPLSFGRWSPLSPSSGS